MGAGVAIILSPLCFVVRYGASGDEGWCVHVLHVAHSAVLHVGLSRPSVSFTPSFQV